MPYKNGNEEIELIDDSNENDENSDVNLKVSK